MFTDEHESFRASVRGFLEREVVPYNDAWEADEFFDSHELFRKFGAAGLLGLEYEPEYGGQGADHSFKVVLGEELGRILCPSVSLAVSVQIDMSTPSLARFGTPDLKERYLAPAISGDMVTAIAVTEPDADPMSLRSVLGRCVPAMSGSSTARSSTSPMACRQTGSVYLARTSDEGDYGGMSQIVVPTDIEGFTVSRKLDKLGNRASDTAELSFVDARVPVENTIGEIGQGFQQQMAQFQTERMIACYIAVGQMTEALERTAAYLKERRAFGKRLIDNQHIQYRLADLWAELDLVRHYNYACAQAYLRHEDTRRYATDREAQGR